MPLSRFESVATVARKLPLEFWIVIFSTSNGDATTSCDVMLYQKLRIAEVALEGMLTVWYMVPKRLLPDEPSAFER